jgi:hypothetical protein
MIRQRQDGNPSEVELLATGEDRCGNCFNLCGGKKKDQVRWRLLKQLQKCVESLPGEAVDFIEDHNLVATLRRSVAQAFGQLSDLLDF